jgi:two-component system nitrate/nitrite response regulator NarL
MIRFGAVDDDRMLLDGLSRSFADAADLWLAAVATTVDELLATRRPGPSSPGPPSTELPSTGPSNTGPSGWGPADQGPLDVVLLDLLLRDGSDPADNVRRLAGAGYRVLVVSVWGRPAQIAEAFAAGAHGYLTKDHDLADLAAAIRTVATGGTAYSPELARACLRNPDPGRPRLSPRERAVLIAYASGMTLQAAARHIGVRPETARTYLERVKTKYQEVGRPAPTKLDLANRAREDRLR